MGIRPGITTVEQAQTILGAHPWVGGVDFYLNEMLVVPWTGIQPGFVGTATAGHITYSPERGDIYQIWVPTTLTMGDLYLSMGEPSGIAFFAADLSNPFAAVVEIEYHAHFLILIMDTPCPLNPDNFWKSQLTIFVISESYRDILRGFHPWDQTWFQGKNAWC